MEEHHPCSLTPLLPMSLSRLLLCAIVLGGALIARSSRAAFSPDPLSLYTYSASTCVPGVVCYADFTYRTSGPLLGQGKCPVSQAAVAIVMGVATPSLFRARVGSASGQLSGILDVYQTSVHSGVANSPQQTLYNPGLGAQDNRGYYAGCVTPYVPVDIVTGALVNPSLKCQELGSASVLYASVMRLSIQQYRCAQAPQWPTEMLAATNPCLNPDPVAGEMCYRACSTSFHASGEHSRRGRSR
jgi:hypothetical protein